MKHELSEFLFKNGWNECAEITKIQWSSADGLTILMRSLPFWETDGLTRDEVTFAVKFSGIQSSSVNFAGDGMETVLEVVKDSQVVAELASTSSVFGNEPLRRVESFLFGYLDACLKNGFGGNPLSYLNLGYKADLEDWQRIVGQSNYLLYSGPSRLADLLCPVFDEYVGSTSRKDFSREGDLKVFRLNDSEIICRGATIEL